MIISKPNHLFNISSFVVYNDHQFILNLRSLTCKRVHSVHSKKSAIFQSLSPLFAEYFLFSFFCGANSVPVCGVFLFLALVHYRYEL